MSKQKFISRLARHQKRWYGKWHTWAGPGTGLILIIVSLTGTLLVFEEELDVWFYPKLFTFEQQEELISFEVATERAKAQYPAVEFRGIFKAEHKNQAYILYEKDEPNRQFIVNPYTGEVMGARVYVESVMGFIRHLHRTLFIPPFGKYLVGISAFICTILIITGLRLWIPRKWRKLKARLSIRVSGTPKRLNFDLHNTVGFYFSPFIALISITGVMITFSQFMVLFMFLLNFESPTSLKEIFSQKSVYQADKEPLSLTQVVLASETAFPRAKVTGIAFPQDSAGVYNVNLLEPTTAETGNRYIVFMDQYSSKVISSSEDEQFKLGKAYINWITPIHYGTFGGMPTRILALLASLVTTSLFVTGFIIWLPRWNKRRRKLKRKRAKLKINIQEPNLEIAYKS